MTELNFCLRCSQELPKGRDLTDPSQIDTIQSLAEEILSSDLDVATLKQITFAKSTEWPVQLLTAILTAESAAMLRACPVHHLTVIHAMYGEQDRIKPQAECKSGQDFVRMKVKQISWLYNKFAPESSWNYIAVDDGCPNKSGDLMEAVIEKEGYKNVRVVRLQAGIDAKTPPFDQLTSTKDSRKGGAILYGLHTAAEEKSNKPHVAAYFDADLSADLGLCGLLVHPILVDKKVVSVGQRYGCSGSFLALPHGADGHPVSLYNNTDCFRMIFRHFARGVLMPPLRPIYDTQCAFKAIDVRCLPDIVKSINTFGPGFDMELLMVVGKLFTHIPEPFALVPFLFIEDKDGSTMSATDEAANKNFFAMLKEMIKTHDRLFAHTALSDDDKKWVQFFRDMDQEGYTRIIVGITAKLGPTPVAALDTQFDLAEMQAMATGQSDTKQML
mmetsp:Transcript_16552/g.32311  ORF Transcript_16552/g.32311 Transcript_16552/m.32311 type:complete len:443 (+) Transcript_16552:8-1336(+)